MSGPSKESYLAAKARKQARMDAMRTRDGVVDLEEWRATAPKVGAWVERHLTVEPWFLGARLVAAPDVGFVLVIAASFPPSPSWLHSSLSDIPFCFVVRNPGAGPG